MTPLLPRALALASAMLLFTGCYKATFHSDPSATRGQEHEEWTDFFVFGLVGTKHVDVLEFCPEGQLAEVRTGGNFGTGLVSFVTLGIYTPRKVYVTCAGPRAAAQARTLELDVSATGEPVRALVHQGTRTTEVAIVRTGDQRFHMQAPRRTP